MGVILFIVSIVFIGWLLLKHVMDNHNFRIRARELREAHNRIAFGDVEFINRDR